MQEICLQASMASGYILIHLGASTARQLKTCEVRRPSCMHTTCKSSKHRQRAKLVRTSQHLGCQVVIFPPIWRFISFSMKLLANEKKAAQQTLQLASSPC